MFFFKTYIFCFIWSEIAIRKGSFSTTENVDCSTLQTSHANQPTTYTYTNTHTNNCQSIHACIHSFNSTSHLHHSFTRTNDPRITIAIHHNDVSIHQPCIARTTQYGIRTCTHHVVMARTQWNAKFACTPLANHHLTTERHTYIHTCMHAQRWERQEWSW